VQTQNIAVIVGQPPAPKHVFSRKMA